MMVKLLSCFFLESRLLDMALVIALQKIYITSPKFHTANDSFDNLLFDWSKGKFILRNWIKIYREFILSLVVSWVYQKQSLPT